MLKGISPLISPELLKVLAEMGHGDTIVFSDAHFPAGSIGPQVIRADGLAVPALLEAVLPLFELDSYVPDPVRMMAAVPGDSLDEDYVALCRKCTGHEIAFLERFAFYEQAKSAYAVVITGETRKYGNIILQKGVTPL